MALWQASLSRNTLPLVTIFYDVEKNTLKDVIEKWRRSRLTKLLEIPLKVELYNTFKVFSDWNRQIQYPLDAKFYTLFFRSGPARKVGRWFSADTVNLCGLWRERNYCGASDRADPHTCRAPLQPPRRSDNQQVVSSPPLLLSSSPPLSPHHTVGKIEDPKGQTK